MIRSSLLALLGLLSACQVDAPNSSPSDSAPHIADGAGSEAPTDQQAQDTLTHTVVLGGLLARYDPTRLARADVLVEVPPDWTRVVPGVMLFARDRAALMGRPECQYGLSGLVTECSPEQEAGVTVATVDQPFETLRAALPTPNSPVTLAGLEGVSWTIGAEGEGATYDLLPAGTDRTWLVVRRHREHENPDAEAVADVLQSLQPAP